MQWKWRQKRNSICRFDPLNSSRRWFIAPQILMYFRISSNFIDSSNHAASRSHWISINNFGFQFHYYYKKRIMSMPMFLCRIESFIKMVKTPKWTVNLNWKSFEIICLLNRGQTFPDRKYLSNDIIIHK